jgi:hypothetical protein
VPPVDVPKKVGGRVGCAFRVDLEQDVAELGPHEHANGLLRDHDDTGDGGRSQRRHDCPSEPYPTHSTYATYLSHVTYPTSQNR